MSAYMPCPKCGAANASRVGYTWWGGALGPRLMNHVKCNNCGSTFNGKTGQPNTTNIIIYSVVVAVIVIIVFMMLRGGM
jgi:transposase-like protein